MSSLLKGKHRLLTVSLQRSEAFCDSELNAEAEVLLYLMIWVDSPIIWWDGTKAQYPEARLGQAPSGTGLVSISRTENNQNGLSTFHNLGFISKASGFPLKMQHLNVFFCTSMFYFTAWILVKPVIQNQFQGCIHLFIGEHQSKNGAWQPGEVLNCAKLQTFLAFCKLQTHKIKSHFYV